MRVVRPCVGERLPIISFKKTAETCFTFATHQSYAGYLSMVTARCYAPRPGSEHMQAALAAARDKPLPIRAAVTKYGISISTLHRYLYNIVVAACTRGKPNALLLSEEIIILEALRYFSSLGTSLSRESFNDLVQHYVQCLPLARKKVIPFSHYRLGDSFMKNFLKRHPEVTFKRKSYLEKMRAVAMSPMNLASHFAGLEQAYKELKITTPEQIFNIDESGFSVRTASCAPSKALFYSRGHCNSLELKLNGNAQHVTIMPVVSADDQSWSPVVILQGTRAKFRKRED